MARIDQIREMLADDPSDTFLRYALAMELGNQEEGSDEALSIYDDLMKLEKPYVPAFFMAGQLLARMDQNDRAGEILTQGIEEARKQNDMHAAGEMSEFLASLSDEF